MTRGESVDSQVRPRRDPASRLTPIERPTLETGDTSCLSGPWADIARLIGESEAEISRRLDELEVMFMDFVYGRAGGRAPPGPPERPALPPESTGLLMALHQDFNALAGEQKALRGHLAGQPRHEDLRQEIGMGLDRIAALVSDRHGRQEAERKGLMALRMGVESAITRLGDMLQTLETSRSGQEEATADPRIDRIEARLDELTAHIADGLPRPEEWREILHSEIGQLDGRLTTALGTGHRRLEAERRAMSRFFNGLDTVLARLEAATQRMEQHDAALRGNTLFPDLESRLSGIESRLNQLTAPPATATQDTLREISMVLAEFVALQERRAHDGPRLAQAESREMRS